MANPFQFAGGYRDPTSFYKFGARYHDPSVGRWTQRDPVPSELPYAYAGANPVNFMDPSGLEWWDPSDWDVDWKRVAWSCAGGAITGAATGGHASAPGPVGGAVVGCGIDAQSKSLGKHLRKKQRQSMEVPSQPLCQVRLL